MARNDLIRQAIRLPLRLSARLVGRSLRARIRGHPTAQARLRARLGIEPETPVVTWGEVTERGVAAWAATQRGVRWAETSGSTARPKRLPFTSARLRSIRRGSWEAAVQAGRVHAVRQPTLFVLAALKRDASLSSLMLETPARTGRLDALVMPSRLLWEPAWAEALDAYGPTGCRLLLLLLSNPGFVYSTNPSTLAVFLARLESDWEGSARAARDLLAGEAPAPVREAVRRVGARGWQARLRRAAQAQSLPPLGELLDGLRCFACWDGGYVTPFLERIRASLPAPRFQHVPMYSMSTETVETQAFYDEAGRAHFLPLAPGVLYEFLPAGAPDDPAALLPATALTPGSDYTLVVSDVYGLRRYQTCDLFRCQERVRGLPDLRFLRRRGLSYSFTGEKLTGEQVQAAFAGLRARVPELAAGGAQLTLIPALLPEGELPHYRLVVAWPGGGPEREEEVLVGWGRACQELLCAQNAELTAKLESQRLGGLRVHSWDYDELASRLGGHAGGQEQRGWETQFKLLPLYTRRWEELGLPGPLERVGP